MSCQFNGISPNTPDNQSEPSDLHNSVDEMVYLIHKIHGFVYLCAYKMKCSKTRVCHDAD